MADIGVNGTPELLERWMRRCPRLNLNRQDIRGNTILTTAVGAFNNKLVCWLLDREEVSVTLTNRKSKTALLVALEVGNWTAVELLAHHGAVKGAETQLLYPLHSLCMRSEKTPAIHWLRTLAILLRHGASMDRVMWKVGTVLDATVQRKERLWSYVLVLLGARLLFEGSRHRVYFPEHLFNVPFSIFLKEFSSAWVVVTLIRRYFQQNVCCTFCVPAADRLLLSHRDCGDSALHFSDSLRFRSAELPSLLSFNSLSSLSMLSGSKIQFNLFSSNSVNNLQKRGAVINRNDSTKTDQDFLSVGPLEFLAMLAALGAVETSACPQRRSRALPAFNCETRHCSSDASWACPPYLANTYKTNIASRPIITKNRSKQAQCSSTGKDSKRQAKNLDIHFTPFVTLREISFWCPK